MELREVKPLELDKELRFLSDGIFGFTYGSHIARYCKAPLEIKFAMSKVDNINARFFFRVEKIAVDQIKLVGYVSEETELLLGNWKNVFEREIILMPFPCKGFNNLAKIDIDKNLNINERTIVQDDGTKMAILDIKRIQLKEDIGIKHREDDEKIIVAKTKERFWYKGWFHFILLLSALASIIGLIWNLAKGLY